MADHQQPSGPGRQNGLEGRESHEVQVLRRLVQHQQLGRWLTPREAEVLELLQDGSTNAEITRELSIGMETVRTHARNIYRKLGIASRRELIRLARQEPVVVDEDRRPVRAS